MSVKDEQKKLIKELLEYKGITADNIAEQLNLSRATISNNINGTVAQQEKILSAICYESDQFAKTISKFIAFEDWSDIVSGALQNHKRYLIKLTEIAMNNKIPLPQNMFSFHDYELLRMTMKIYDYLVKK